MPKISMLSWVQIGLLVAAVLLGVVSLVDLANGPRCHHAHLIPGNPVSYRG